MGLHRSSLHVALAGTLAFTVSCAQKRKAPESLTLQMMRMEAEATTYEEPKTIAATEPAKMNTIERIAFVSTIDQNKPNSLWKAIGAAQPQMVIIAGNSVHSTKYNEKPLLAQYKKLDQISEYKELREKVPFMATWDSLDYGIKSGDSSFSGKNESRKAFLKYWNYIAKLQSKDQKGVEHSTIIGPVGKRLQIILLDTRTFASPWLQNPTTKEFKKNWSRSATLLGSAQWAWLEKELKKEAEHRLIISPLQMAANSWNGERWGLFPHERQRFFDTLRKAQAKNVLMISGGRSFASLGKVDLIKYPPLYDLTVGPVNSETSKREEDFHYVGTPVEANNFGLVEWNWETQSLLLKVIDENSKPVFSQELRFIN